jgi:hypothetical protein
MQIVELREREAVRADHVIQLAQQIPRIAI